MKMDLSPVRDDPKSHGAKPLSVPQPASLAADASYAVPPHDCKITSFKSAASTPLPPRRAHPCSLQRANVRLLRGQPLCSAGEFGMVVERILGESEERGWTPNAVTYNIYMSALCRMGFADVAFRQFRIMRKRGLSPTVETVNILFDCLCRGSRFIEAESWLERSELGWDVDVFCYNTALSCLCFS
jgi:pentatricopeptide repeat protein